MPTSRPKRGADELRKAARHVRHEHATFVEQSALALQQPPLAPALRVAAYEATMVHLRNLCDFFCPSQDPDYPPRDTSIIVSDFPGGRATPVPPVLEQARRVVNTQIVHLTYDRNDVDPAGQKLDWPAIRAAVDKLVDGFPRDPKAARYMVFRSKPTVGDRANVESTTPIGTTTTGLPKPRK